MVLNLQQKKALIVGIANEHSIAYGIAKKLAASGVELGITYAKDKALPFVDPLAKELNADIFMPLDVQNPAQQEALFKTITQRWGRLDILVHSIAYAPTPDLHGRVIDSSAEGFLSAMDISCHSLMRLAKAAEPLMQNGGTILTISFYGAEKVIKNYSIMGPIKAALEASTRYLAAELGGKNIRVHALSPGPLATRAATGLKGFEKILAAAAAKAPGRHHVTIEDLGSLASFLCSDEAASMTGNIIYLDNGNNIMA